MGNQNDRLGVTPLQSSSRPLRRLGMSTRDAEEEFDFLLNLLASDGIGPDPGQPRGASGDGDGDDRGVRVQRGSDGRLDLGQVKAFYESKNMRGGVGETREPVSTDRPRNSTGLSIALSAQTFGPCLAYPTRFHLGFRVFRMLD